MHIWVFMLSFVIEELKECLILQKSQKKKLWVHSNYV
jgi:hypothetical protein